MTNSAVTVACGGWGWGWGGGCCTNRPHRMLQATRLVTMAVPAPSQLPPGKVLVRQLWAGINASDINYTDGR